MARLQMFTLFIFAVMIGVMLSNCGGGDPTSTPVPTGTERVLTLAPTQIPTAVVGGLPTNEVGVTLSPTAYRIIEFVLVDADTGRDVARLFDGAIVNLAWFDVDNYNVRVTTSPERVGSVQLWVNGEEGLQNGSPYSFFGDSNGVYEPVTETGYFVFRAVAFTEANLNGESGYQASIRVSIANSNFLGGVD